MTVSWNFIHTTIRLSSFCNSQFFKQLVVPFDFKFCWCGAPHRRRFQYRIGISGRKWTQWVNCGCKWRWRESSTWQNTSSLASYCGRGMGGRGACSVATRRWGTGRITSCVWTIVCSIMWPYGTPGTTLSTKWSWGAPAVWPWGIINTTLGCAHGYHSTPLIFRPMRTSSLPPSGRRFPRHRCVNARTPHGSRMTPDGSSTPGFPSGDPQTGANIVFVT